MGRTEAQYQGELTRRLGEMFPGCFVMKNNAREIQGILDITILWGRQWAMLEVKISDTAAVQPNQLHYVERFDDMSFAAFIYPQNEEEVLHALQQAFGVA